MARRNRRKHHQSQHNPDQDQGSSPNPSQLKHHNPKVKSKFPTPEPPRLGSHMITMPRGPAADRNSPSATQLSKNPFGPGPKRIVPTLLKSLPHGNSQVQGGNYRLSNCTAKQQYGDGVKKWNTKGKGQRGVLSAKQNAVFLAKSRAFREYLLRSAEEGRIQLESWFPEEAIFVGESGDGDDSAVDEGEENGEMDWQPEGEFRIVYLGEQMPQAAPVPNYDSCYNENYGGEIATHLYSDSSSPSPRPRRGVTEDSTPYFHWPDAHTATAPTAVNGTLSAPGRSKVPRYSGYTDGGENMPASKDLTAGFEYDPDTGGTRRRGVSESSSNGSNRWEALERRMGRDEVGIPVGTMMNNPWRINTPPVSPGKEDEI